MLSSKVGRDRVPAAKMVKNLVGHKIGGNSIDRFDHFDPGAAEKPAGTDFGPLSDVTDNKNVSGISRVVNARPLAFSGGLGGFGSLDRCGENCHFFAPLAMKGLYTQFMRYALVA
jgi:hypothetical protein